MEVPFVISIPYELILVMYLVAIMTTGLAVYISIKKVNEKELIYIIKGIYLPNFYAKKKNFIRTHLTIYNLEACC